MKWLEDLDEIEIWYLLSVLKPLHASLVEIYNFLTTNCRKEVIMNDWICLEIFDAIQIGVSNLLSLDLFDDVW